VAGIRATCGCSSKPLQITFNYAGDGGDKYSVSGS